MTDKQIIIDDLMKQLNEKTVAIMLLRETLDRKEQECEFSNLKIIQLQETLSQYETDLSTKDCIVETCKAQYKELKAENDKLKETFDGLFKIQYKLADSNKKLRQCLTEIREIAESYNHYSEHAPVSGYSDILQKISECEVNDE